MSNVHQNHKSQDKKYDLIERTVKFSENVIDLASKLPQNTITIPIISQLVRSVTSIGANYSEADEANSKKDFINKIAIANKETKESKYWLRIIAHTMPQFKDEIRILWKEAQELNLILSAIIRNSKNKK